MTDSEVIETLAEREGWTNISAPYQRNSFWGNIGTRPHRRIVPSYLTSRDAIQPVLAGMSWDERKQLTLKLQQMCKDTVFTDVDATMFLLTLPPTDLARAVAEVLKGFFKEDND